MYKLIKPLVFSLALSSGFSLPALADAKSELREQLSGITDFTANYTQQVLDVDGSELQLAQGELKLLRPGKVFWQQVSPDDDLIISDGETIWYFSPFIEQVSILDAQSAISTTPLILLSTDQDSAWEQYQVETSEAGYLLSSVSDPDQAQFWIDLVDGKINAFSIREQSGQQNNFELSEFESNTGIDSAMFSFEIPSGVSVDDQR
ncbi:outer membrane lipoprotein carrier protein LolA [Alginatibacterium sediminis]|uniref:Outer-membrane lipoprotein carrier protein n=1 Tax=Alginatibacterium sediminis TaxID=2164068 RepID=A0A420EGR4_9ALTE|nr:outer membrane lipoprotein chaperone LolA [Alginatibacterium sediminis]RKF19854.1 outer membrane lipoprotein carrier protein LolA [Alginatibacterium sediminis]